ncbi:Serine/threonine-protein phosphatase 4 regulatory subunit 2 [Nakaseomyces glabratus]|nr:Serine/threonine-protein phosphatase 4 regulatory subunit 2 [Nakaseomyces glabratus]
MDSASIDAIHMNGIKSKYLYDILKGIVREKNYDVLETINVSEFLAELLDHMVNTIPNELFQTKVNNGRHTVGRKEDSEENEEAVYGTDIDDANDVHTRQLDDLKRISTHLTTNFKDKSQLPFTIVRICELCFDPFHYFKTYELDKFVNALQKCCLVRGAWRRYELKDVRELSNSQSDKEHIDCDQNDVALSKIPWLDEKMAVKEDANTTRNELMNVSNNSDDSSLQNDTGIAISSQNDTRDLSKRRLPLSDENDGNYANPASFSKRNKASES